MRIEVRCQPEKIIFVGSSAVQEDKRRMWA
jgi:hypothetical protein